MLPQQEIENLTHARTDEIVPPGWTLVALEARFASADQALKAEDKVMHIARMVAQASLDTTWPTNEEWKARLPEWFLPSFHYYSKEELEQYLKHNDREAIGWHFGSWLDSMHNRSWRWWSMQRDETRVRVNVIVDGWPYSVGALAHLLKAAGADSVFDQSEKVNI